MPHLRGVAALLVLVLSGALLTHLLWKPPAASRPATLSAGDVPQSAGGYLALPESDADRAQARAAELYLHGATVLARRFGRGGDRIDFLLVSGTSRTALHDPRLCLSGAGWSLSDAHAEALSGTPVILQTAKAATRSPLPDTSLAYFYLLDGRVVSSPTSVRAALLWSALLGRQSTPVYFFRFLQPLPADPAVARAHHLRLQAFARDIWLAIGPKLRAGCEAGSLRHKLVVVPMRAYPEPVEPVRPQRSEGAVMTADPHRPKPFDVFEVQRGVTGVSLE